MSDSSEEGDPASWEDTFMDNLQGIACGLFEWSIPIAIAVAVALYTGKYSNARQTSTDALTGFRIVSATLIAVEHSGHMLFLNGSGVFLVLSGCVISLSRRQEPGRLKSTFTSVREALKFIFVRLLRVAPLVWVFVAVSEVVRDDEGHVCFDVASPVRFLAQVLLNLAKLVFTHPWDLLSLGYQSHLHSLWFACLIAVVYIMYPVLELVIFGRAGQLTRKRAAMVVAACVAVQLGILWLVFWATRAGRQTGCQLVCLNLDGIWPCPEFPGYLELLADLFGPHIASDRIAGEEGTCQFDWYRNCWTRMPQFVLGMLIPHVDVKSELAVVCADVAAVVVLLVTCLMPNKMMDASFELRLAVYSHSFIPFTLLIIWGLCFGPKQSRFGKILCAPYFVAAGNFAYGVYVWQSPLKVRYLHGRRGLTWRSPSFPLYLAFLYVVAWTTHRLVEEPVSDFARYLMGRAPRRAPPAEQQASTLEGRAELLQTEEKELSSDSNDTDSSSESSSGQACCKTAW